MAIRFTASRTTPAQWKGMMSLPSRYCLTIKWIQAPSWGFLLDLFPFFWSVTLIFIPNAVFVFPSLSFLCWKIFFLPFHLNMSSATYKMLSSTFFSFRFWEYLHLEYNIAVPITNVNLIPSYLYTNHTQRMAFSFWRIPRFISLFQIFKKLVQMGWGVFLFLSFTCSAMGPFNMNF